MPLTKTLQPFAIGLMSLGFPSRWCRNKDRTALLLSYQAFKIRLRLNGFWVKLRTSSFAWLQRPTPRLLSGSALSIAVMPEGV